MPRSAATGTCPYCGSEARLALTAPDVNRRIGQQEFDLFGCGACGLIFIGNPPDDLGPYYQGDYHRRPTSIADLKGALKGQAYKLDLVGAAIAGGRLLEIGPSVGMFCHLAKEAGFEVSAIEYDEACVRFLRDVVGVRAVHSADPALVLEQEDERYDAICLWHSLEHLPEPWRVLEAAGARLTPNGVLIVAVPNPQAWQARVLGRHWPHWDLPRHLFEFPIPWMKTMAARLGLAVETITTRDSGSLYWNRFSWGMVLQGLARGGWLRRQLWRLGVLVGWALQPWEGREGRGAAYTIVLRRPA